MPTPYWKQAERDFEDFFKVYGKQAFVARLSDTAMAKATGGGMVAAQPSDYVVTLHGETFYAEVKSTKDLTTFHFSNIRKQQLAAARRQLAAGGKYLFFVYAVEHEQWYCVPAQVVIDTIRIKKKKSMTWKEMEPFKYAIS